MQTDHSETTAVMRHRLAVQNERSAWRRLLHSTGSVGSDERSNALDVWTAAHHDMIETQAAATAAAVQRATESLRGCAVLLQRPVPSLAVPAPLLPPPEPGRSYLDRDGATWKVAAVRNDAFEPEYYMAQLERQPLPPGDAPVDVYSEDWPVFCVVHGLRRTHSR